ncbi:glycosyltransferase [Terriglobus albidus]|uniref:Glycosyltransferase n=1 Tax=Terriglobus albidus TaxID=1592106 RepID=A0A5B9E811_9BACT|nr:glycosyltransferase [Terriglobus albidus]QEE28372.1 glycosyltransferase [Terriglobus albidus]
MIPRSSDPEPEISVVMTTCSRAHLLPGVLDALLGQSLLANVSVEMVIVDDQSTDNTPEVLARYQAEAAIPVRILQGAKQGVAAARNLAVQHARGRWLASFDDDEIAPPHWLQTLYGVAQQNHAVCVGGATALSLPEGRSFSEVGPRARRLLGEILFSEERSMQFHELPSTNNVLIRRDVFESLGGFDLNFTEGGEDTDLFQRMHRAGHRMWLAPEAKVLHLIPPRRLDPHVLSQSAMRTGAIEARLAGARNSLPSLLYNLTGRLVLAVARDLPQLAAGRLSRQPAKVLDAQLSLAVTAGLYRGLSAARGGSSQFLSRMDFRSRHGERPDTPPRQ